MRVLACLVWMIVCLGLSGCGLFGKKAPNPPSNPNLLPPGPGQPRSDGLLPGDHAVAAPAKGILAGQVIDSYNRKPPPTAVQYRVVSGRDGKEPVGAPIEAWTDANGYFTIVGLEVGKHYQLLARAKDGEHLLAGTTWATVPNPKVLIRISEDFVNSSIPPMPPAPAFPSGKEPAKPKPNGETAAPGGNGAAMHRPAELGPPVPGHAAVPVQVPPTNPTRPITVPVKPARPELDVGIRNPFAPRSVPTNPVPPLVTSTTTDHPATAPVAVPSCVLTSNRLENLALESLDGSIWEFRTHRRGRLVLLDFWGTWCPACMKSLGKLSELQQQYRTAGLEVIGIAYEYGSPNDQIVRLKSVQARYINYRVLLGGNPKAICPVREKLGVERYPTLILLDESGQILWRNEGLEKAQYDQLENLIKQRLGLR